MAVGAAPALALLVLSVLGAGPATAAGTNLVGTFALTPGACQSSAASGTYFRMVQPSGTVANGPFVSNGDSTCADKTYTLLAPGSDGGLVTGGYQPAPSPAFDAQGNSLSKRIVVPAVFFGVKFSISTDPKDRQSGVDVTAPAIQVDPSGKLTGDLRAWEATWNKQNFNQGAPKPDGSTPQLTTPVHGTYNATTGAFLLEWTSTIVGGPFNEFTGSWHLAGTFRGGAAASPAAATQGTPNVGRPSQGGAVVATGAAGGQATTATTDASTNAEAAPRSAKVVGAVSEKGWKPPAWLIVVTAIVGVGAALALLLPAQRATSDGTTE
ncbi:MAG TPA: hypothetical protein VFB78_08215 [Acidimicrobiales bacterium]|nr:hypothetical protein [Acidimicrobiales bacterium]